MTAPPKNDIAVRPLMVEVRSESRPGLSHRVTLAWCDCEDFFWSHEHDAEDPFCKHIKEAYARVAGWHLSSPDGMAVRPLVVEVRSESRPGLSHRVTLAWCDCEDFFWRHPHTDLGDPFCKHIVEAYACVAGWHHSE